MLYPSIFGERLFDDFFDDMFKPAKRLTAVNQVPTVMRTDIKEKDNSFELEIDLPGYQKEDVKAELKDGYMTITAEHSNQNEEKNKEGKVIRRERYQGICRRSFYVGDAVTEKDIQAKFKDGVLTLEVPKKEKQPEVETKKYIAIEG